MGKKRLYNAAEQYVAVIEAIERTSDPERLVVLEEKRIILHNTLLDLLGREGIPFKSREDVTRWAYYITREKK